MTANISVELKAEMAGALSTLAVCMRIERRDGNVYGFSTHDAPIVYEGVRYEPTASFNPSDIVSTDNMDVDNVTVEGAISGDTLTEDELRAGYWDRAAFRIFMVNWADLTMGDAKLRKGWLGPVTLNRQTFVVELLGLMEAYATSIGKSTQAMCRASLGDGDCQVNLEGSPSYTVTGTIDVADTDFFTLHDSARTEEAGYFDEGRLTLHYPQGDLSYEVKAYTLEGGSPGTGVWITKTAYAYDATGVAYTMTRGCNRMFSTCRDVFNNVINFQGEPYLKGNDKLVQVGRHT